MEDRGWRIEIHPSTILDPPSSMIPSVVRCSLLYDGRRRSWVRSAGVGAIARYVGPGLGDILLIRRNRRLAFENRIRQLGDDQLDGTQAIVIAGNRQIDGVRIAVGVDKGHGL